MALVGFFQYCGGHLLSVDLESDTTMKKDDDIRARMQDVANRVNERFPEGTGFIILAFPFKGGRMNYISNCHRGDAVNAVKEWLIQASGPEEWMKHIK